MFCYIEVPQVWLYIILSEKFREKVSYLLYLNQRWKYSLMKKEALSLIQCLNTLIFYMFGPILTHFISKYFAKKNRKLLIRGKFSSLLNDEINDTPTKFQTLKISLAICLPAVQLFVTNTQYLYKSRSGWCLTILIRN